MPSEKKAGLDGILFVAAVLLWAIGGLLVYSATVNGSMAYIFQQQVMWMVMGVVIIMIMVMIPTEIIYKFTMPYYFITLIMLGMVITGGEAAKGAARWIPIGGVRLQPSEFAKIGLLLMLARYLSSHRVSLYRVKTLVWPSVIILTPFLLVMKQPDLGTALVFMAMSLPMFYWSGMSLVELFYLLSPLASVVLSAIPLILSYGSTDPVGIASSIPWALFFFVVLGVLFLLKPPRYIIIVVVVLNLVLAMFTNFLWNNEKIGLQDYQKKRVISFINPQEDPRGSGYQVIQSMIAIGSGQVKGKGYLQGSQVNLAYLPEQHTDFIFSVLGEQFGFLGCVVILLLFFFVIARALMTTHHLRNRFANLILVGGGAMLAFHVFVNIAMVIGMMPVTGLPLPLLSYGGSFALTMSILLGLMLTVRVDSQNY